MATMLGVCDYGSCPGFVDFKLQACNTMGTATCCLCVNVKHVL